MDRDRAQLEVGGKGGPAPGLTAWGLIGSLSHWHWPGHGASPAEVRVSLALPPGPGPEHWQGRQSQ